MTLQMPVNKEDHMQGNIGAPLTMVEYGDYECPNCREADAIVKHLQKHFGDKLLYVFRNFPLSEIHPHALEAATIAEAASLQNKFWPVHDLLFKNQNKFSQAQFLYDVHAAGSDAEQLIKDMHSQRVRENIDRDIESAARSGVNGTPTFFLNGKRHDGYYGYEDLRTALEKLLL